LAAIVQPLQSLKIGTKRGIYKLWRGTIAFYLWVNGQKVGYSENSMSPAEFDITKIFAKAKINWP
jgi:hypothetical protein